MHKACAQNEPRVRFGGLDLRNVILVRDNTDKKIVFITLNSKYHLKLRKIKSAHNLMSHFNIIHYNAKPKSNISFSHTM